MNGVAIRKGSTTDYNLTFQNGDMSWACDKNASVVTSGCQIYNLPLLMKSSLKSKGS